jgi:tricorn protease-like protein
MSQQNAAATPMWRSFTNKPDFSPWKALPSNVNLEDRNVAMNDLQRRSEAFDLSKEDRVADLEFNEVLWKAIKGENSEMPAPKRAAFLKVEEEEDED